MAGKNFTEILMRWNRQENKRKMPWKGEKDPYKVWLSEIILQQTRVEQGWAYYERFIKKYPTIQLLAKAKDEEVFKLWEGLGYYTRCKNLLYTARFITTNYNGNFPGNYDDILALKGVGSYTAAAIASFCFNLPYAVIDGNVFRILARVFGMAIPVDSTEGKKEFSILAAAHLDKNQPGLYNQAIMDFGATVCKPQLPLCIECRLNTICVAYNNALVNKLPVKEKTLQKKTRWFTYFIFCADDKILVRQRTEKDIWQNLYEFYLAESASNPAWDKAGVLYFLKEQLGMLSADSVTIINARPQQLTHQLIKGVFIIVNINTIPAKLEGSYNRWVSAREMKKLAFPAFIRQYIDSENIQATLF